MGALKGSIAVRRYRVTAALPQKDARGKLGRGVRAHGFVPINPRSTEARSHGWAGLFDVGTDVGVELSADKLFYNSDGGEELRVTMRVDTLKPPTADVRRIVDGEAATKAAKEGRPISRGEKRALKEEAVRKLRLTTPVRSQRVDVVWQLDSGRLFLFSTVKSMTELFVDLFARSFALAIDEEGATRLAREQLGDKLEPIDPADELHRGFGGLRPLPVPPVEDDDDDDGAPRKAPRTDEHGFDA